MSTPKTKELALDANMDANAVEALVERLLQSRGAPLCIDAANVARTSVPFFQVLLSAALTWIEDKTSFSIVNASRAMLDDMDLLGLSPAQIGIG